MKITGNTQGEIAGPCEKQGMQGAIEIFSFDHLVQIPRSEDTGLPVWPRLHSNIKVSKEIDKSTPKLYQALCTGELLQEVDFAWIHGTDIGSEEKYYTVRIEQALITGIRPWAPNRLDPDNTVYRYLEEVLFAYEKITWTWVPDGIEYVDYWTKSGKGI